MNEFGGIPFRGGCTLVSSSNGRFRYLISKPMKKAGGDCAREEAGKLRFERQQEYLNMFDMRNPLTPYLNEEKSEAQVFRARRTSRLDQQNPRHVAIRMYNVANGAR